MPLFFACGVACNGCGAEFGQLFTLATEAVDAARADGWYVAPIKNVALCPDCDGENE